MTQKPGVPMPPNGPVPAILGVSGYFEGKCFKISSVLRFGRDKNFNEIVYPLIPGKVISPVHCSATYHEGKIVLCDWGSTYGTFTKKGRLDQCEKLELTYGDEFWLVAEDEKWRIVDFREIHSTTAKTGVI